MVQNKKAIIKSLGFMTTPRYAGFFITPPRPGVRAGNHQLPEGSKERRSSRPF
jgi:hypothetical protein